MNKHLLSLWNDPSIEGGLDSAFVLFIITRITSIGLLPDTYNCGLRMRMRRECRERFPRHRFQRKPLVSDPGMHHGTCVTHVPWCMSESLTHGGRENVPGIPGACAARAYLARGQWGSSVIVPVSTWIIFEEYPSFASPLCIATIVRLFQNWTKFWKHNRNWQTPTHKTAWSVRILALHVLYLFGAFAHTSDVSVTFFKHHRALSLWEYTPTYKL